MLAVFLPDTILILELYLYSVFLAVRNPIESRSIPARALDGRKTPSHSLCLTLHDTEFLHGMTSWGVGFWWLFGE
jgi:hypothetical protein